MGVNDKTLSNVGCLLGLRKPLLVRVCVAILVLLSVFSFFCITSLGDCTRPQHQETTGKLSFHDFDRIAL